MKNSNQISKLIFITLFLNSVVITPFISYDPINLVRLLFLSISGIISIYLILKLKNYYISSPNLKITLIVGFYLIWTIISYFLSGVSRLDGLYGVFGRNTGLITNLSLATLLLLSMYISNTKSLISLTHILVSCGVISGIYGLIQIFGIDPFDWTTSYTPVFGFLGNPNFHSSFMAIIASISFILVVNNKDLGKRLGFALLAILSIVNINGTKSQQGFLVLLICLFAYLFLTIMVKYNSRLVRTCALIVTASGVIAIALDILQKAPWKSIFYENSVSYRGDFWRAGWKMTLDNPLFGVGPDGYRDNYMQAQDLVAYSRAGKDSITDSAHNYFIDISSSGGFPLLASFVLIQVFIVYSIYMNFKLRNNLTPYYILLVIAWLGYSIQSLISIRNIGLSTLGWILSGFILGFKSEAIEIKKIKINKLVAVFLSMCMVFLTLPQLINDANFRASAKNGDVLGIKNSVIKWPQDIHRMNYATKIFRENNFLTEALIVARAAIEVNPNNLDAWRELSLLPNTTSAEKIQAILKIKELDPLAP